MKAIIFCIMLIVAFSDVVDDAKNLTPEEFASVYLMPIENLNIPPEIERVDYTPFLKYMAVPDSFDSRTTWPECIHPIRDQGKCGSCWAFALTEVISDRFCIASNKNINHVMSPQFSVSCDTKNLGCNGGYLPRSWEFLEGSGTITDSCWTYKSATGTAPACSTFTACEDGQPIKHFYSQKGKTKSFANIESAQIEIMANGPIETGFYVYDDFPKYTGGIYVKSSSKLLGGHAVKIVGWGVENGVKYWIVANSWNTSWGEQGFFRFKMNQCNFESQMITGYADTTKVSE